MATIREIWPYILWLIGVTVGAILLQFVGDATGTRIKGDTWIGEVIFRVAFMVYTYLIVESFWNLIP